MIHSMIKWYACRCFSLINSSKNSFGMYKVIINYLQSTILQRQSQYHQNGAHNGNLERGKGSGRSWSRSCYCGRILLRYSGFIGWMSSWGRGWCVSCPLCSRCLWIHRFLRGGCCYLNYLFETFETNIRNSLRFFSVWTRRVIVWLTVVTGATSEVDGTEGLVVVWMEEVNCFDLVTPWGRS